jgi:hypothetical protein
MSKKKQTISVTEYAKERKISRQAVLQRLTPVILELPGIEKAEKIGNYWALFRKQNSRKSE